MDNVITSLENKFAKILSVVETDLSTIRTGKATPHLIENLIVDAYESKMKLLELATISATDASTLIVTPFDIANLETIIKAISTANLGLTAIPEDTKIRCVVPPLSEERRKEFVKLASTKIEGGKVMVRQARHEAMEEVGKIASDEDSKTRMQKEIQKLTDETVAKLDEMASLKEKELMAI